MAGTGIFKTVNGKQVEISARQVKAEIMRLRGWSEEEYNRERKQLTKRINTFNALIETGDGIREDRTAVQILYGEAKSRKRYGEKYEPSTRTVELRQMAATSGSRRGQKALEKARQTHELYVTTRFAGLIAKNKGAAKIAEKIKDPVRLEKALARYANDMHIAIDKKQEATSTEAIPWSTDHYGSDTYDVDVTAYLDDHVQSGDWEEVDPSDIFAE